MLLNRNEPNSLARCFVWGKKQTEHRVMSGRSPLTDKLLHGSFISLWIGDLYPANVNERLNIATHNRGNNLYTHSLHVTIEIILDCFHYFSGYLASNHNEAELLPASLLSVFISSKSPVAYERRVLLYKVT